MTGGFSSLKAINAESVSVYSCHNGGDIVVINFHRISVSTWYGNAFRISAPLWGESTLLQHHWNGKAVIWNTSCSFDWIKSCRDLLMFYVKCLIIIFVNKWLPTSLIHHDICVNTRRRFNQSLNSSMALLCQPIYFWQANRSVTSYVAQWV